MLMIVVNRQLLRLMRLARRVVNGCSIRYPSAAVQYTAVQQYSAQQEEERESSSAILTCWEALQV
jgi:hypothetical protein